MATPEESEHRKGTASSKICEAERMEKVLEHSTILKRGTEEYFQIPKKDTSSNKLELVLTHNTFI